MTPHEVLEALIDRGYAAFCFVDGSFSTPAVAARPRIHEPLTVEFDSLRAVVRTTCAGGLWRLRLSDDRQLVDHRDQPDELGPQHLVAPQRPDVQVTGTVFDPGKRWLGRRFTLTLARGAMQSIELFPSPFGAARGASVVASLRFPDDRPAAFARVELEVKTQPNASLVRGRCDHNGDVCLSLRRVPVLPAPVPPSTNHTVAAELRVAALRPQAPAPQPHGDLPSDALLPDSDLVACDVGGTDAPGYANVLSVQVDPSAVSRIVSHADKFLRIRFQP